MTKINDNSQLSFWQLISSTSKIEIPIIQRDYAQGRDNVKTNKIRHRFLKSLIETIDKIDGTLELDFVYGDISKDGVFQPLDGQQRLTTLFLLHWFIALKIGKLSDNKKQFMKFTYETRISSREFCNELTNKGANIGNGISISEQIKDSTWFFLSWKKDPTIKAMLIMLDSIEKKLQDKLQDKSKDELTAFWNKLISENSPITFHFKELKDIGLTDDLYIKMNARGKELTDFENFKARFEKHIDENKWEIEITNPRFSFFHKIDTVWTDLFWKHRVDDNLVDNEFVNFISGIAINYYAQNLDIEENQEVDKIVKKELERKSKKQNVTDEAIKRERIERRIAVLFNNSNEINPLDFPSKKAFEYLKKSFNIYSENKNDVLLPNNLPLWDFCKTKKVKINNDTEVDNTLFVEFIKDKETTYKQRVLFFAQTQYLLKADDSNSDSFTDWMRVVRNIVQNSTIDSAAAFIRAIGLISEISVGYSDIYKYLAQNPVKSGFASNQISEEKIKAGLIDLPKEWKSQILKVEDDNFLKGEIRFLFDFSFVSKEYNLGKFKKISDVFLMLFEFKDDILRRALLTQEDYLIWDGYTYSLEAHRYSLLNKEEEWKVAFRKKNKNFINAVKKILELVETDSKIGRKIILINIINDAILFNDWRDLIIKEDNSLKGCNHKRICLSNDQKSLYILNKTRVVGVNYKQFKTI